METNSRGRMRRIMGRFFGRKMRKKGGFHRGGKWVLRFLGVSLSGNLLSLTRDR
jgi:hypothetical protein